MPFQKGQITNPNGRPKGAHNRIGAKQREFLNSFLFEDTEKVRSIMSELKGAEYLKFYVALMHYAVPRPLPVEVNDVPQIEAFIAMTPEERQEVILEVQERLKNNKKK